MYTIQSYCYIIIIKISDCNDKIFPQILSPIKHFSTNQTSLHPTQQKTSFHKSNTSFSCQKKKKMLSSIKRVCISEISHHISNRLSIIKQLITNQTCHHNTHLPPINYLITLFKHFIIN